MGLLLRLWIALGRMDQVWPDEHFQTLEQASRIVFGRGMATWEWKDGFRSWITPALFVPVLWLCKLAGVTGGRWAILIPRTLMACLSAWLIPRLDLLMRQLSIRPLARAVGVAAFAFSVPMILWAPTPLTDTLATICLWAALPAILGLERSSLPRDWFLAGLLAGLSFLMRSQMIAWGVAFFAVLLAYRPGWRKAILGAAGYLVCVAIYGVVDWATWGEPFRSILQQLRKGLQLSEFYGKSPWYDYLPRLRENLGGPFLAVALGLGAIAAIQWFARSERKPVDRERLRKALLVFVPLLALLAFYSKITHKETRFLEPILPGFFVLLALAADSLLPERLLSRLGSAVPARGRIAGLALLAVLAAPVAGFRAIRAPLYLTTVDISELEAAVYDRHKLSPRGDDCFLLLDHNWSWTKGELILGQKVRLEDKRVEQTSEQDFRTCPFAVVPSRREQEFLGQAGRAGAGSWKEIARSRSDFVLLENVAVTASRGD